MSQVLTLIAKPLADDHVRIALSVMPAGTVVDWLAPGQACDLLFAGPEAGPETGYAAAARQALAGAPVDLFCQPAGPARRRQLLVADMDSTIISAECIDEMADVLGQKALVAAITERAMAGEIGFAEALRERANMLAGLTEADLQMVYDQRIRLNPGARELVATMRAHGAQTALVSGGFSFFTERVAAAAGFDHQQGNRLRIVAGRLDGGVEEPILGPVEKLTAMQTLSRQRNLDPNATLAVGDGANDMAMVKAAGLGVAYHAKAVLAQAAMARIDHGDLTALLYLQGYRAEQFQN
ncbi:MAG: phosphoserine phosphatase SerB [Rhodospirillaceae bacterium]|jgi:phosphoserine phosphatase|nr:phosphoserine phosphatase SerB [Rhodospirillaceae bacterium]